MTCLITLATFLPTTGKLPLVRLLSSRTSAEINLSSSCSLSCVYSVSSFPLPYASSTNNVAGPARLASPFDSLSRLSNWGLRQSSQLWRSAVRKSVDKSSYLVLRAPRPCRRQTQAARISSASWLTFVDNSIANWEGWRASSFVRRRRLLANAC